MTIEEIEIVVTAKVEEALKEFQKMSPALKQVMKQAEEAFSKVDTKKMTNKLHQAVNFMKKKMQDLKKSSENNEIAIKVNNKDAQKQISQLQRQIDSLQEKINARRIKLDIITPKLDKIANEPMNKVNPGRLENNKQYINLSDKEQMATKEIAYYSKQLTEAKNKMAKLKSQTEQTATTQSKLGSFFGAFKQKVDQIKPSISGVKNIFSKMPGIGQSLSKITQNVTGHIKNMSSGIKNGLGHVLKYAGALFSLQGIYSILSGCAQNWLSSQNAGAKQLSANIEYMKYAMGSAFAPVIQYVTGLIYQLMKAIQSVVYALFRVNIFAKASASSYASMAGNAKKAKNETKSLSDVHSEINNISDNNNAENGSSGSTAPSFDLSGIDSQMSPLAKKLYDFFKPLVDSWNKYGPTLVEQIKTTAGQVGGLISSVWGSFEKIITNGTVYTSLELILAIIGNIAEAFANAWNYNGNGDAIVQNLANAFNNLLTAINNVVQSEGFQNWLNDCSDKFRVISEKIASIDWKPFVDAMANIGAGIGTIALEILTGLVDIFKWIVENPGVAEILIGIAVAIGLISAAIGIWNAVQAVWNVLMAPATLTIMLIVGAIVALIAIVIAVVEVIKNWGAISEWLGQKFAEAKEAITNTFQNIGQWFSDRWNDICNVFSNVGNWFKDKFNNAKDGVQNAWQNIGNWFGDRKKDITNTFNNIGSWFKGKFQDAYNGIKNVFSNIGNFFSNIWNGIKNTFSALGTKIGDAIGGAVKSGINGVISLIERTINNAIRLINGGIGMINLIPGVSIGNINTLSLPRLAKGNVAYDETLAIFGEYSGASNNPEITTPQNIMRDTFEDVLSEFNSNNGQPVHVTIQYLGKEIFDDVIDHINSRTRRTGKNTIVMVGD